MGGTSTDVSLAYEGQSRVTKDWYVEFGYPIRFSSIEVLTIGAGGGSLAWIDEAGSLRNGPQSAGANPGPACYGNGNHQCHQHRRQRGAGPAGLEPRRRQDHARPRTRRRGGETVSPQSFGMDCARRPRTPSSASPTPTWRMRSA